MPTLITVLSTMLGFFVGVLSVRSYYAERERRRWPFPADAHVLAILVNGERYVLPTPIPLRNGDRFQFSAEIRT